MIAPARPRTLNRRQLRRLTIVGDDAGDGGAAPTRPRTRGECAAGPRPCPWVSCRHHLYADVRPNGSLKLNRPDVAADELERLPATCALDVADATAGDGMSGAAVGVLLNISRERVRQVVEGALERIEPDMRELAAEVDD
jgi:hypothetical protein